jgi:hypothetical protein
MLCKRRELFAMGTHTSLGINARVMMFSIKCMRVIE